MTIPIVFLLAGTALAFAALGAAFVFRVCRTFGL